MNSSIQICVHNVFYEVNSIGNHSNSKTIHMYKVILLTCVLDSQMLDPDLTVHRSHSAEYCAISLCVWKLRQNLQL